MLQQSTQYENSGHHGKSIYFSLKMRERAELYIAARDIFVRMLTRSPKSACFKSRRDSLRRMFKFSGELSFFARLSSSRKVSPIANAADFLCSSDFSQHEQML